jgi:hypothetical protein
LGRLSRQGRGTGDRAEELTAVESVVRQGHLNEPILLSVGGRRPNHYNPSPSEDDSDIAQWVENNEYS